MHSCYRGAAIVILLSPCHPVDWLSKIETWIAALSNIMNRTCPSVPCLRACLADLAEETGNHVDWLSSWKIDSLTTHQPLDFLAAYETVLIQCSRCPSSSMKRPSYAFNRNLSHNPDNTTKRKGQSPKFVRFMLRVRSWQALSGRSNSCTVIASVRLHIHILRCLQADDTDHDGGEPSGKSTNVR